MSFQLTPRTFGTVLALCLLTGCSQPNTEWHNEIVTKENATWNGSDKPALNVLRLRSHAWKIIDYEPKKETCNWGFKVTIEYPANLDTSMKKMLFKTRLAKIEYELYDKDGFPSRSFFCQSLR